MSKSLACRLLGLAALIAASAQPARAADLVDMTAAKSEGRVVWYTSTPIAQANKIAELFKAETGIEVELFRSGGSAILRRFMQEHAAGNAAADVLTTSDPAASNVLAADGVFATFKPDQFDALPAEAKQPDGYYVAQRLNLMTIVARTDKIAEADLPKSWQDLLDPKYKGQLVMTDPSFTSLQLSVVGTLAEKYGWEFYEKLLQNDIMIVQGNQQISDNLKRGERLIGVGILDSYAAEDRRSGHPIKTIYPTDGVLIIPSPTAVVADSPHPNAGKAFAAFMLTDKVQQIFPDDGGYAARTDIPAPEGSPDLDTLTVLPVDYAAIEENSADIKEQFNEIFQ